MNIITFPNLNLTFNINPVAFNFFGKDIYWYGIIIAIAMLLATYLASRDSDRDGISWDAIIDYIIIAVPVGIICARLYYVIFNIEYYSRNLSEIYKIWNGGLAIYGGIIGAIVVTVIFCRKRKIKFLKLCDYLAPFLPLAQSIGRWGNFVNAEAYGSATSSFLKMGILDKVTNEYIYVHPTFLYESFFTFLIFVVLYIKRKNKKEDGEIFYLYMFLYGIVRMVVEGFRADSLFLYNFRISQVLAAIFAIIFGILLLKQKIKPKKAK